MSMEFVMGNSLETLPKTIDFNFEELKGQLAESLALYTGLVVTEDGIKGAKEDRAKLNKLREALENKRKEVKRECMAPYTDFEAKVKELVGLIDQPIAAIDAQLKAVIDRTVARWLEVKNKDFYYIVTMADEDTSSADTTLACFRGYVDCVHGAVEKGTIIGNGVYEPGKIANMPAMKQAYEMGKTV